MHVWSEGGAHRVLLDRGIAWCRLWRRLDATPGASALEAGQMVESARRMVRQGLCPLGFIVDLAAGAVDPREAAALLSPLLEIVEAREIPLAVIQRAGPSPILEAVVGGTAPFWGRVFSGVSTAEAWIRAGGRDGDDDEPVLQPPAERSVASSQGR